MRPPVIVRLIVSIVHAATSSIARVTLSIVMLLAVGMFLVTPSHARPPQGSITIGVVRDGPSYQDELTTRIEDQVKLLLPPGVSVTFKAAEAFNADWDFTRVDDALQAAIADPDVDYVLVTGFLSSLGVAGGKIPLTKPVISSYPQPEDLVNLPVSADGKSLVKNYAFVVVPLQLQSEIEAFKMLISFDTLYVAIDNEIVDRARSYRDEIETFERENAIHVEFLPIYRDAARNAAEIDSTMQAVLLTYAPRLTIAERQQLIEQFNAKRVPTFSHIGHSDVELGALAALTPDIHKQLVRRAAMDISEIYRGTKVSELPVTVSVESKLLINAKTAAEIDYVPSLSVRGFASFLYPEYLDSGARPLTFDGVLMLAGKQSRRLQIKDTDVEQSLRATQVIRGPMLPQIRSGAEGDVIRNDYLNDQTTLPKEQGSVGLSLTQMIYNDRLISDYRASKRFYESDVSDREAVRLDVITEAGIEFLGYIQAQSLNRVTADNYELTSENLDLARRRLEVGYSGPDDVFRWESLLASGRVQLYESEAEIERRRLALNQLLVVNQSIRWVPEDVEVKEEEFFFLQGRITGVFDDAMTFEKFRALMVTIAEENSPELAAITMVMEAQGIQLGQRKRQFVLPQFGLSVDYNYNFHREPEISGFDNNLYFFRVFANLPLFEGGSRYYDMERIKSGLAGLEFQQDLVRERVERRTRTALRLLEASYPSLGYSRSAAVNAKKTLDVVQEKYAQGIVNVTDLLSAQNESFVAGQRTVIVKYRFLADLLEFQRALSWFEALKTDEEKDALVQRIEEVTGIGP